VFQLALEQRKGLETIKFTLLDSDTVIENDWAVKPVSRLEEDRDRTKLKRKESKHKKKEETRPKEYFSPKILERIESVSLNYGNEKITMYNCIIITLLQLTLRSGNLTLSSNSSFLPDGTGFCR